MKRFLAVFLLLLVSFATAQTTDSKNAASKPEDLSSWFTLLLAAQASGGFDASHPVEPTVYAGVKIGGPLGRARKGRDDKTITVDLGYDRLQGHNGFSTEVSVMLPVFRYPKPQSDERKNYFRIYAEPGLGYRLGDGSFGGYGSTKVMIALLSDKRLSIGGVSPYVEIQRRFPFTSPLRGDTRISIGIMTAICNHCGFD